MLRFNNNHTQTYSRSVVLHLEYDNEFVNKEQMDQPYVIYQTIRTRFYFGRSDLIFTCAPDFNLTFSTYKYNYIYQHMNNNLY